MWKIIARAERKKDIRADREQVKREPAERGSV
jgi:hypothetical protein